MSAACVRGIKSSDNLKLGPECTFKQYRLLFVLLAHSNQACCYHLSLTHCVLNPSDQQNKVPVHSQLVNWGMSRQGPENQKYPSQLSKRLLQSVITSTQSVQINKHKSSSAAQTSLWCLSLSVLSIGASKLKTVMPLGRPPSSFLLVELWLLAGMFWSESSCSVCQGISALKITSFFSS